MLRLYYSLMDWINCVGIYGFNSLVDIYSSASVHLVERLFITPMDRFNCVGVSNPNSLVDVCSLDGIYIMAFFFLGRQIITGSN